MKGITITKTAAAVSFWARSGTTLSPATAGDNVEVTSNAAAGAIKATSTNYSAIVGTTDVNSVAYAGVAGNSVLGIGVRAQSSSNYGAYIQSGTGVAAVVFTNDNVALKVRNVSASNVALETFTNSSETNTVSPLISIIKGTTGLAAAGIGGFIKCEIENSGGGAAEASRLVTKLTDVTNLAEDSAFEIWLLSAGVLARKLAISDIGKLTLDTYGIGTHTGTPTTTLNSDTDGNVIETTFGEYASLKVGDVAGGDYTAIEADGTIKFHGDATVFRDELSELITKRIVTGADKVVINSVEGSVTYKNNAELTDYVVTSPQLNHDRKLGSAIYPHIHWWQTSANMPNWLLQYRWQIQGEAKVTTWTYLPWTTNRATWVSDTLNQITGFGAIAAPPGDGISDIVQFRVIRDVDNDSGEFDDGAETDPLAQDVVNFDVHIEIDTVGSREEYVK